MHRTLGTLAAVLTFTLACASGRSTSLTSSWRAPETPAWPLRRMLASLVSTDLPMRRSIEDRLAARIPGTFAAYRSVPELSLGDAELAREQLRGKLFDGAIVMRVLGHDERAVPPAGWQASSPTFYAYWGPWWGAVRDPGYVVAERDVVVEIRIYSLAEDRLLWAGRTATANPRSMQALLDESVDAAVRELWTKRVFQWPESIVGARSAPWPACRVTAAQARSAADVATGGRAADEG